MAVNLKKDLKKIRNMSYLNKDFESFRADLLEYSQIHYRDNLSDFSEASLGGLFLDMAAYVGDVLSYYLDHQFSELSLETATEDENIENLVRDAGVKITGAAPSFCEVDVIFEVSAVLENGIYKPSSGELPILKQGSVFSSVSGINFETLEDVDFSQTDEYGKLKASIVVEAINSDLNPVTFLVKRSVTVSSGKRATESFTIGSFVPFYTIRLANSDVTEILSVVDNELNKYYEVDSLAHDIVYIASDNVNGDSHEAEFSLTVNPAPRRFIRTGDYESGQSTLRFGSGNSEFEDEDVIEDPTDFALPLFGERKNFSINALDPNNLLNTNTLGVGPQNTSLTVTYRHGGGLAHNVRERTITIVKTLDLEFPTSTSAIVENTVRNSIIINNPSKAKGGESRPTLEELRTIAFSARNSQSRIVNVQDLLYRVYTMPSKLGRVYRIGITKNPMSNSILMHVICRDSNAKLTFANDTLKDNIAVYLSQYRLLSDSYDIVDARIINLYLEYVISVDRGYNSIDVRSRCNFNLSRYLDTKNSQIGKPINKTDIHSIIANTEGVLSVASINFRNRLVFEEGRNYSGELFSVLENTRKQQIFPPPGGIIEIKYSDEDIKGAVI
jgi:hypothetical protein